MELCRNKSVIAIVAPLFALPVSGADPVCHQEIEVPAPTAVALDAQARLLVVGSPRDDAGGTRPDRGGSASVYGLDGDGQWVKRATLMAANRGPGDLFGFAVAISGDRQTIAVGAIYEDSAARGVNAHADDEAARDAGAVYVFARDGDRWNQQAYLKASNAMAGDHIGQTLALGADGDKLAVYGDN